MQIKVNGEDRQVSEKIKLSELIAEMNLLEQRIAVEMNLEIIPRSEYERTGFSEGDRIEIVHAIGGG